MLVKECVGSYYETRASSVLFAWSGVHLLGRGRAESTVHLRGLLSRRVEKIR